MGNGPVHCLQLESQAVQMSTLAKNPSGQVRVSTQVREGVRINGEMQVRQASGPGPAQVAQVK